MLEHLFQNNLKWSDRMREQDPDFFKKLMGQQSPQYFWIGCADSRVPANEIVDLMPGEFRTPQRRQRGGTHRFKLSVSSAVRC